MPRLDFMRDLAPPPDDEEFDPNDVEGFKAKLNRRFECSLQESLVENRDLVFKTVDIEKKVTAIKQKFKDLIIARYEKKM